jgi:hypothetical protein
MDYHNIQEKCENLFLKMTLLKFKNAPPKNKYIMMHKKGPRGVCFHPSFSKDTMWH